MKPALAVVFVAALVLLASTGDPVAQSKFGKPAATHVAPANVYPDPELTPGEAATFSAAAIKKRYKCPASLAKKKKNATCTYSQAHRNVPNSVKNAVYEAYDKLYPGFADYCHAMDVPKAQRRKFTQGKNQRCEVDHFCPVGIGCANTEKNLWIQRADTTYNGQRMGFHEKDDLEAWGIAQVKVGKLKPEEFDRKIWADWVSYYFEVRPLHSNASN
jgi:hypothetical protein